MTERETCDDPTDRNPENYAAETKRKKRKRKKKSSNFCQALVGTDGGADATFASSSTSPPAAADFPGGAGSVGGAGSAGGAGSVRFRGEKLEQGSFTQNKTKNPRESCDGSVWCLIRTEDFQNCE